MPSLSHLLFGIAIVILIAIAMVLLLPGSKQASMPQEAQLGAWSVPGKPPLPH